MSIPDADIMSKYYDDVAVVDGMHPFMLSFCHGAQIHDMKTKVNVPEQEELMFVFPVMYKYNEVEHLVSYIPVLYLNSSIGVIGGLTFGMRKEYKPSMVVEEFDQGKQWTIPDIIYGHFV